MRPDQAASGWGNADLRSFLWLRFKSTSDSVSATSRLMFAARQSRSATATFAQHYLICLFGLALILRLAGVATFHSGHEFPIEYQIDVEADHFARGILDGDGFTNPYVPESRLVSAWRAPIQPLLWASFLAVGGGQTWTYHILVYLFNAVVSAVGVVGAAVLASRLFDGSIGRLTGLLLVFYPPSVYYACNSTSDATMVSTILIWIVAVSQQAPALQRRTTIWLGALVGLGACLNPSTLVVSGIAVGVRTAGLPGWGNRMRTSLTIVVVAGAIAAPWIIRNRVVFGEFVFLRSNFGALLWAGNHGAGGARHGSSFLPAFSALLPELKQVGEPELSRRCKARAFEWITAHPVACARATIERAVLFWSKEVFMGAFPEVTAITTGLPFMLGAIGCVAAWRRGWRIGLPLAIILSYPLVYYVTLVEARYRYPIEPFVLMFSTVSMTTLWEVVRTPACPRPLYRSST